MSLEEFKYFFSYTRNDSEFVLKLAKDLRAVGANLWLDQLDILGGQHWDSTVEKALKSCKGMIAVLSPESVASDNVMDEVSYALNEGKLVVPVLIRPCNIPYRLQRVQYIDFTADYDTGFSQLLRALGIEQPVQPLESTAAQEPVVPEPSLPKQPEAAVGEQKEAEVHSKSQKTKVLAAICIVTLIAIVSIVIFRKYLKTYSLTATADPNGSVTKDPDKTSYNHGETMVLEAIPNMGYSFTNWSGDLDDSTNPATLEMYADKSVKANFALKTYSLTATADPNGSVMKDPDKTSYNHGETVTLKAVANTGYSFKNWSGALSDSNNPIELVIMDVDKSVKANFALKTYSLTATAVDGSVMKSPDRASYNHGETVILEAVPDTELGYSFTNWSGDLDGSTNRSTLVMDADKSVIASFALEAGNVVTNSIGMKLVSIPAGSFMMGSSGSPKQLADEYKEILIKINQTEEHFRDEFPQHKVRISKGFWMGKTVVTQGQYKSVMNAQPWLGKDNVQESANNPAVYVSWDDAVEFCRKLSKKEGKTYRLPTEAEWEYACRAGTTTQFSFGDSGSSLDDYAWHKRNAFAVNQKYAHPVGQKKHNPWGLYDMHGNVWEWCSDWYGKDYYYDSPSVDPKGLSSGTERSSRGGAWDCAEDALRCSCRRHTNPDAPFQLAPFYLIGFRVVRSQ